MGKLPFTDAVEQAQAAKGALWLLITSDMRMLTRLARTLKGVLVPEFPDFNFARIDCNRSTTAAVCLSVCEELPVMASRRLVWLRDVHLLEKEQLTRVTAGLEDLPPTTAVLLSAAPARATGDTGSSSSRAAATDSGEAERTDSGQGLRALSSLVEKRGNLVAGTLSHEELLAWVQREAPRRGLQASSAVLTAFVDRVGDDYTLLDSELDKLLCYVGPERAAVAADIAAICTWSRSARGYELTSAIDDRDSVRALSILHVLLDHDEHPLQLLGLLGAHYRTLLKVRAARSSGIPRAEMISRLKVNEYRLKHLLRAEQRYVRPGLDAVLEMLLRADEALKSGRNLSARLRDDLILETLVLRLCS